MKADLVVKNGRIVTPERTYAGGVAISDGKFVAIGADDVLPDGVRVIDVKGKHILPGLIDAHVHFRDPGLTHKEDFATGSTAAVCGGITTVLDMPNVIPPTQSEKEVLEKRKIGESKSLCDFGLYGVVHQSNADDILPMANAGVIGYKIFFGETVGELPFPDDGMCHEVFSNITESGLRLAVHAENRPIQYYWTDKMKAEDMSAPVHWEKTRPWMCEAEAINHLIFLADMYKTPLHVVHVTTKQGAHMIRDAKARGQDVTGETGPHYLLREPEDMNEVGPLLKMNPPVRGGEHRTVLWEGLLQGFLDMIATDHSPHTLEEKGCDINGKMVKNAIWDCISGFCGVETGVPLILNEVNKGRMSLNHYVRLASENPARIWQMYPKKGSISLAADGDLTIVDMDKEMTIDPTKLHSKNPPTPWGGWKVKGVPVATIVRGNVQMEDGEPVGKVIGEMQLPLKEEAALAP
jgi:dihydroorotase